MNPVAENQTAVQASDSRPEGFDATVSFLRSLDLSKIKQGSQSKTYFDLDSGLNLNLKLVEDQHQRGSVYLTARITTSSDAGEVAADDLYEQYVINQNDYIDLDSIAEHDPELYDSLFNAHVECRKQLRARPGARRDPFATRTGRTSGRRGRQATAEYDDGDAGESGNRRGNRRGRNFDF